MPKSPDAFRTISEVADWLGVQPHVLRFWESKFAQVKPIKRAGGRRYYRPADMLLLGGIKKLLHDDGMTIKGVQKLLRESGVAFVSDQSQPLDDLTMAVIDGQAIPAPAEAPALLAEQPEKNDEAEAAEDVAAAPDTATGDAQSAVTNEDDADAEPAAAQDEAAAQDSDSTADSGEEATASIEEPEAESPAEAASPKPLEEVAFLQSDEETPAERDADSTEGETAAQDAAETPESAPAAEPDASEPLETGAQSNSPDDDPAPGLPLDNDTAVSEDGVEAAAPETQQTEDEAAPDEMAPPEPAPSTDSGMVEPAAAEPEEAPVLPAFRHRTAVQEPPAEKTADEVAASAPNDAAEEREAEDSGPFRVHVPETSSEPPKPDVISVTLPDIDALPAKPGALTALARHPKLDAEKRAALRPLLARLTAHRDTVAATFSDGRKD